jgi:hypothetical protein
MDALAITNLCLQVALTVDNKWVAIEISPGSLETDGILL